MSSSENDVCTSEIKMYTVGGVEITFPNKAYPSQLSMMDKIIRCLSKKQNCLLELPTGSGKSLALLCSSLAWQRKCEKDLIVLNAELEAQLISNSGFSETENYISLNQNSFSVRNLPSKAEDHEFSIHKSQDHGTVTHESQDHETIIHKSEDHETVAPKKVTHLDNFNFVNKSKYIASHPVFLDDDDDFQPMAKKIYKGPSTSNIGAHESTSQILQTSPLADHCYNNRVNSASKVKSDILDTKKLKMETSNESKLDSSKLPELKQQMFLKKRPQIFFGTRTHKQIGQIIRELKKTIYKDAKMTILSSRERTCVNPLVLNADNKQEACNDLLNDINGPQCLYYHNSHYVTHFKPSRLSKAWDIEDLITKLKPMRICPYFSTRILVDHSDIIFCPYNYLIDPLIRSSLDIQLKNNIMILDEAHNIEDFARDAASWNVSHLQIFEVVNDLTRIAPQCGNVSRYYYEVCNIMSAFYHWLSDSQSLLKQQAFDYACKVYSGAEIVAILEYIGVGPEKHELFKTNIGVILEDENEKETAEKRDKLTGGTIFLLKGFSLLLKFIYKDDLKYMSDYRCVSSQKRSNFVSPNSKIGNKVRSLMVSQNAQNSQQPIADLSIQFYCMNPAVAFSDFKDDIHSLIVTSGTLSPFASFQSELNMPFDIKFEANHVVCQSHTWVGTIGCGPTGSVLNATYRNTELYTFQDEIGNLILEICSVIPFGVLCFVPSYGMLEKLTSRWRITGLWEHLEEKKYIVCEPKGATKNFDKLISKYYKAAQEISCQSDINGALLIAVCRGKVSEGLDFADNFARAVITVGIPFPNFKDTQIDLKMKYNDINRSNKELMSGREWYETQAFRALNQALGRCIRHRNDFGALILIDERLQKNQHYVNLLSKWIRMKITHFSSSSSALESLKQFASRFPM